MFTSSIPSKNHGWSIAKFVMAGAFCSAALLAPEQQALAQDESSEGTGLLEDPSALNRRIAG